MYMMFFGWSIHIAGLLALLPILGGIEANINAKSRRWKRKNRAKIVYRKLQSALGKWIVGLVSKKKNVESDEKKGDEVEVMVGMEKKAGERIAGTKEVEEKVETKVEKLLPFV